MVQQLKKEAKQKIGKIFNLENRKLREVDKSKLLIAYIIGEGIDNFGRKFIQIKWGRVKGEISLGSLVKPNKEIYLIKYLIPLE